MAYLPEDEQKKADQAGSQTQQQPAAGAPGAGTSGGGGGALPDTQTGGGGQNTTPFASVQNYIAKNRPAAQRLADRVSGSVTAAGDNARNTLAQQQTAYNAEVGKRETVKDQGLLNQIGSDVLGLSGDQQQQTKNTLSATYQGPKSLEESTYYQPVSQAFAAAKERAGLVDTAGGRQQLIASTTPAGQRITRGRVSLDQALLQSDPGTRAQLTAAKTGLSDLDTRLADASAAARQRAAEGRANTDAAVAATRGALTNATGAFQTGLDQRVADTRAQADARTKAIADALRALSTTSNLATKKLTPEQRQNALTWGAANEHAFLPGQNTFNAQTMADAGLTQAQLDEILGQAGTKTAGYMDQFGRGLTKRQERALTDAYGRELGDLTRFQTSLNPEAEIDRGNVASADDYRRLAVLNDLLGEQNTFLDQAQAGRAGTAKTDLSDVDTAALGQAHIGALQAVQSDAGRRLTKNQRSGGESFLKRASGYITPGGVPIKTSTVTGALKGKNPVMSYLDEIFAPRTPTELPRAYKDEEIL